MDDGTTSSDRSSQPASLFPGNQFRTAAAQQAGSSGLKHNPADIDGRADRPAARRLRGSKPGAPEVRRDLLRGYEIQPDALPMDDR